MIELPLRPILKVSNVLNAIDFYTSAFKAKEEHVMYAPDGSRVLLAYIALNGSPLSLTATGDALPLAERDQQDVGITLQLYCDVHLTYEEGLRNGARSIVSPQKLPDGGQLAQLQDPYTHYWILRTAPIVNSGMQ